MSKNMSGSLVRRAAGGLEMILEGMPRTFRGQTRLPGIVKMLGTAAPSQRAALAF